jgi:hypothetical protein
VPNISFGPNATDYLPIRPIALNQEGNRKKLCTRCKEEGCWGDYPGNWYPCDPCGEIGAFDDDGSSIVPHRWFSEEELVSIGKQSITPS